MSLGSFDKVQNNTDNHILDTLNKKVNISDKNLKHIVFEKYFSIINTQFFNDSDRILSNINILDIEDLLTDKKYSIALDQDLNRMWLQFQNII